MKIAVLFLLLAVYSLHSIYINDTDLWYGYKRYMEYTTFKDDAEEEKIVEAFDKRADIIKAKVQDWCRACRHAKDKDFESCLIKEFEKLIFDEEDEIHDIDCKCARNVLMAKIERVINTINEKYNISPYAMSKLTKIIFFDLQTKESRRFS